MAGDNLFADLIPQAGAAPGVLYGPKKTEPVKTATVGGKFGVVGPDGSFTPTYSEDDTQKDALKGAIADLGLDELLKNVSSARDNVRTGWATGTYGALAGLKPGGGTPRQDFLGNIAGIQGGIIAEKLQALKDASKTGASGLGALSEKEGERLASSVAALRDDMSDDQYAKSFTTIAEHALTLAAIRDGKDPTTDEVKKAIQAQAAEYGKVAAEQREPEKAAEPGAKSDPLTAGTPRENTARAPGEKPADMVDMTDSQKTAYAQFWKTNKDPTPQQLSGFLGSIGVPWVEETDAANIIKAVKAGAGYSTAIDRASVLRAEINKQDAVRGPLAESDAETLAKQSSTFNLSDEAAGVGRGISKLVQGENPIEGYKLGRDAERLRIEDARRQLGAGGTAIEVVGALGGAGPGRAVTAIQDIIKGGTAAGALTGFGSGEGAVDSAERAAIGGGTGAAVSGVLGAYANRLSPRALDPELAAQAAAEDVRISGPMVGGRGQQARINKAGVLQSDQTTAPIVQQGFQDTADDIARGVERLGGGGAAQGEAEVGERLQTAGRRFIQRSRGVADRLYNRARTLSGDARFQPTDAIRQADEELAALAANPNSNAAERTFIQRYRDDLATEGGKTIGELRDLRTSLRGNLHEAGLTSSQAEARVMRIIDAVNTDARNSLPRGAADAYRRADAYYRERMVHIDDVLDRFIGGENGVERLSGQQAFDKIKSMANKDGRRLAAVMRDLTQPERLDVAATLAASIGRKAPDEPFTLGAFLAHTRNLSPSARRTIFGPDGATSIENLRALTLRLQRAQAEVNTSRTGRPVSNAIRNSARGVVATLLGSGGFAVGGPVGAAAGVGATAAAVGARAGLKALSARSLMSPRVSNWLASAANVNTRAQAQDAVRRLGVIIAREPQLAVELNPVHKFLSEALTTPAVASDGQGGNNEQP